MENFPNLWTQQSWRMFSEMKMRLHQEFEKGSELFRISQGMMTILSI